MSCFPSPSCALVSGLPEQEHLFLGKVQKEFIDVMGFHASSVWRKNVIDIWLLETTALFILE